MDSTFNADLLFGSDVEALAVERLQMGVCCKLSIAKAAGMPARIGGHLSHAIGAISNSNAESGIRAQTNSPCAHCDGERSAADSWPFRDGIKAPRPRILESEPAVLARNVVPQTASVLRIGCGMP